MLSTQCFNHLRSGGIKLIQITPNGKFEISLSLRDNKMMGL